MKKCQKPQTDLAARTTLAALALFAAALVREQSADLRSRCLLYATGPLVWELLDRPGEQPRKFALPAEQARSVYQQAVDEAKDAGTALDGAGVDTETVAAASGTGAPEPVAGRRGNGGRRGGVIVFAIGIRYLMGWSMATHSADRERPEWPPHPDRVFMALAAAHYETDGSDNEREALSWLEGQGPPNVWASDATYRETLTTYVPVNDTSRAQSQSGQAAVSAASPRRVAASPGKTGPGSPGGFR